MSYTKNLGYWFKDSEFEGFNYEIEIKETIVKEKSEFQLIEIVDTIPFGKTLITDGLIMMSELDEFIYHEMMVHVPLSLVKHPKRVLVIGGGDGGCVREISKYPSIERIDLVEIDKKIVELSQKYLNTWEGTNYSILNYYFQDGFKFIEETQEIYNSIIIDISAPIEIAKDMYSKRFFKNVIEHLSEEGTFVIQSESIYLTPNVTKLLINETKKLIKYSLSYVVAIPSFISLWSFVIGSKKNDPTKPIYNNGLDKGKLKFYNEEVHTSSFGLPQFLKKYIFSDDINENLDLLDREVFKKISKGST
ncbi:MAG: polyamine aminopropyltransferase [Brevinematia bacterium]